MTFADIERAASRQSPEPDREADGATIADIAAYWALRGMYADYRAGYIDKETGKEIKNRIHEVYEEIKRIERIEADIMSRARELAKIPANTGQCRWCENTRRAITGLKVIGGDAK